VVTLFEIDGLTHQKSPKSWIAQWNGKIRLHYAKQLLQAELQRILPMTQRKTPVAIEDSCLKRLERPSEDFWPQFEKELRAKQLAAIVEKRPCGRLFAHTCCCVALPLLSRSLCIRGERFRFSPIRASGLDQVVPFRRKRDVAACSSDEGIRSCASETSEMTVADRESAAPQRASRRGGGVSDRRAPKLKRTHKHRGFPFGRHQRSGEARRPVRSPSILPHPGE